jgi:hypothetical protein
MDSTDWSAETDISVPIIISGIPDGQHTIKVIGRNSIGTWQEIASAVTYTWVIDTTPPIAALDNLPSLFTQDTSVQIFVSGDQVEVYKYNLDGSWSGEIDVSQDINESSLAEGEHTIAVIGADSLFNWQTIATSYTWTVDTLAPALDTASPANGQSISLTEIITIVFDESVDAASIILGGSLLDEPYDIAWSTTVFPDDTIILSPQGQWSPGINQTIIIDISDFAGNLLSGLTLGYDSRIGGGNVYVHASSGNDLSGDGSQGNPYQTIQKGVTEAEYMYNDAVVHVSEGSYSVNSDPNSDGDNSDGTYIVMADGISILGGYSQANWADNDPDLYVSIITDFATEGPMTEPPNRAVDCGSGLTSATILDGFTINGSPANLGYSAGIYCATSPTIQNNKIYGATGLVLKGLTRPGKFGPV